MAIKTMAHRQRISRGVKDAWARRAKWQPPKGTEAMFADLKTKVGATEARRLVQEHARIRGTQ